MKVGPIYVTNIFSVLVELGKTDYIFLIPISNYLPYVFIWRRTATVEIERSGELKYL